MASTSQHLAELPQPKYVLRAFPPDAVFVRAARDLVDELTLSGDTREITRSLIGELADNAARHAATPYMVTLSAAPAVVTVEVQDQSPRLPVMRPLRMVLEHGWEHGRGLHIVDWLADDWGTTLLGDAGKAVWARVHLAA
jgi:anti-sigma regulatory factor (Ser/Thr protein kinase)